MNNHELADAYFRVASQYSNDSSTYNMMRRLIEESNNDITVFYKENKNLKGLSIRGIGKKVKHVLEAILEHGEEDAKRIIALEMEAKLFVRRSPIRAHMPLSPSRKKKLDDYMRNRRD